MLITLNIKKIYILIVKIEGRELTIEGMILLNLPYLYIIYLEFGGNLFFLILKTGNTCHFKIQKIYFLQLMINLTQIP